MADEAIRAGNLDLAALVQAEALEDVKRYGQNSIGLPNVHDQLANLKTLRRSFREA